MPSITIVKSGAPGETTARLSDVLAGLSCALDLTEGQREGHAARTCLIGMRLAHVLRLPAHVRSPLYYGLLMKDLGCSSNAARVAALFAAGDQGIKSGLTLTDWSRTLPGVRFAARHVAAGRAWPARIWRLLGLLAHGPAGAREAVLTRCERGATIATMLELPADTADAIRALDEHWDGSGQPYALRGDQIPLLARILGLAQTFEVFHREHGIDAAYDVVVARRSTWFDPVIVEALLAMRRDRAFWQQLAEDDALGAVAAAEPSEQVITLDEARLDRVAEAFACVIDAKSPWTFQHSQGVADTSVAIARVMGLDDAQVRDVRRAALLHDIGKLGVSSLVLDKPAKLTDEEFAAMRRHPAATRRILARSGCLAHLADAASAHHERPDGRGYDRGIGEAHLPDLARILCTADIFDALVASRPYRDGMPIERALDVMRRDVGTGIDAGCFAALTSALETLAPPRSPQEVPPAARFVPDLAEDYAQAA